MFLGQNATCQYWSFQISSELEKVKTTVFEQFLEGFIKQIASHRDVERRTDSLEVEETDVVIHAQQP